MVQVALAIAVGDVAHHVGHNDVVYLHRAVPPLHLLLMDPALLCLWPLVRFQTIRR